MKQVIPCIFPRAAITPDYELYLIAILIDTHATIVVKSEFVAQKNCILSETTKISLRHSNSAFFSKIKFIVIYLYIYTHLILKRNPPPPALLNRQLPTQLFTLTLMST